MAEPFQVRHAADSDLGDIASIEQRVFTDAWPRAAFADLFNEFSFAAESGDRVIGYLFGRVAADEAEVLNLAVSPEHRRQGIATALLAACLDRVRLAGVTTVYLEVRSANHEAQSFYQKAGFVEHGRRRRYYSHPSDDAVVMRLPIGAQKRPEKKRP